MEEEERKTTLTEHLLCTALPPNSVNLTQALKSSAFCIFVTGEPLKVATPSAIPQMASQGHEDLLYVYLLLRQIQKEGRAE